jgi:hypothetical protein
MTVQWGEYYTTEETGNTYEEALSKAMTSIVNLLEPGQQVLRRVPDTLEYPTWCLVRSDACTSPGGQMVGVTAIFEYVYPEDLTDA